MPDIAPSVLDIQFPNVWNNVWCPRNELEEEVNIALVILPVDFPLPNNDLDTTEGMNPAMMSEVGDCFAEVE